MFIIFLFSSRKSFLKGTSSFRKPVVTQKNLPVLSPVQVKQPKKHDNYNKWIPYASSPIPCVYIINLKHSLFTIGTSSCYAFLPRLKEQDAAVSLFTSCGRWTYVVAASRSSAVELPLVLLWGYAAAPNPPHAPTCEPCSPDIELICQHLGDGRGDLKGGRQW